MIQVLPIFFFLVLQHSQAIRFDIAPAGTKCVSEDLQTNTLVLANYHIVKADLPHGSNPKINARLTSPYGTTLHFAENKDEGQFGFTTTEAGNYMACFWMHSHADNVPASIELDWKFGVAAKDWASIAKKEKLEGLELELRRLEDVVDSIREEMYYLRDKEAEMRGVNETTNARVAWFSIMSLFLCLMVAAWQLWHLKSYFERKKIL
ncbi:hypothetical protein SELMODRAFT_74858 [Selaginella moellendorffii]|uniref:GOLD domain-containing protein n=2 Tax=Selaginella moellendorffii TaxID=88036 RepID=D8QN30_SELML|nr:hypothetical protein SELMODRAFT_86434 [Selaginella moellendorffii]EFJ38035.1 hypothetical protein SELMODRAFT_74858 [Selaginella moellendorffii]